jgi:cell fate (sporulation/competence/biofilm development) regulator YlbF (YheA/YmcA/DUF963 family)
MGEGFSFFLRRCQIDWRFLGIGRFWALGICWIDMTDNEVFTPTHWHLHLAARCGLLRGTKIIFMSTKVETKTRELCEAIIEQLQTGGIKQRIDTFLADDSARGAYESLMNKGQALQEKQHSGAVLEPAEISAFEKDRDALLKNPVATGFLDAQEQMHELQHLVQKQVSKTIELGRIPTADELSGGGGGGCGSGSCGCH